jgi:hypothetical protein
LLIEARNPKIWLSKSASNSTSFLQIVPTCFSLLIASCSEL